MIINKITAWFLTPAGKKFSYLFAGTATCGVLLAHTVPHTILIDQYQDVVRRYKNGFSVALPQKLVDRFQKALDLTGVEPDDKSLYKPFLVYGFDVFSAGSSHSKFGVIVGLPVNFTYDNKESVVKHEIRLQDDSVTWETDDGKALLEALILSEEAQLYAMAREIKFRQTPKMFIDTITGVLATAGTYGFANTLNTKFNYYARPLVLRLILYSIIGAFTFGSYAFCKDFGQLYYEQKIDKELIKINPIFVRGGKEYYNKMLARNIALRKLLGKEGERAYTALGNENSLLRLKHMPLVQRKSIFEEKVDVQ